MRLLHTSDWHLGRSLHGVDLIDHQAQVLDQLIDVVGQEGIEAVLVSGDVYDRSVPPVRAVELLDDVLCRLSERTSVVIIPGNHDSSARLGFGSRILNARVRVRTELAQLAEPVEFVDAHGPVLVYAIPYLYPDIARRQLADPEGEPLPRSHDACMAAAVARVHADRATRPSAHRCVVMAHAFVVGTGSGLLESASERDISVGGVDSVGAAAFEGFDYVALGHLHRPQQPRVDSQVTLRYCGSPLRYSFSEADQVKSFTIVDLDAGGVAGVQTVEIPQPRPMAQVAGTLDELLIVGGEGVMADAWVQVTVTDPVRPTGMYEQVRQRFPHALVVRHEPATGPLAQSDVVLATASDPVALTRQFVEYVTGGVPSAAELAAFGDAYEVARDAAGEH